MTNMLLYEYPEMEKWPSLLSRTAADSRDSEDDVVSSILSDVRRGGNAKVLAYVKAFDGYDATEECLKVTDEEIREAESSVPETLKAAMQAAADNITAFHKAQMPSDIEVETSPGVLCRQLNVPIRTVGLYIPGGTAPLFSSVLMLALPAKIAGCERVILCTPCNSEGKVSPSILYAASLCGVTEIFKIGGAVAVAAMAFGTETVPKVDKIFGPGNRYVMKAKQQVSRFCAIDMPAGPSEVMIIADETAEADFVAADFLSQLEHGGDSQAVLLTTSRDLVLSVEKSVEKQAACLGRKDFVGKSMARSMAVLLEDTEEMARMANLYAPEHLIIVTKDNESVLSMIRNAGSVFLGKYSPESAGDYASGTNHTLPTSGWAVSCSGVNISTFMKKMTVQEISREGLMALAPTIEAMACAEGLDAHANAVRIRLNDK